MIIFQAEAFPSALFLFQAEAFPSALFLFYQQAQFEPQEEELEIGSPKGFADLGALADYLLDAISVMSKADEDNLKALLMAAVMASLKLDAVIDGRGDTQLEWKRFFKKAKTMYDACTPRPYK